MDLSLLANTVEPVATSDFVARFASSALIGFVGSGAIYGVGYVLITRALRVNRQQIEAWLEKQRLRLQSGPVPILELAHPILTGALQVVYGTTLLRRLLTSSCLATLFTGIIFLFLMGDYWRVPLSVRSEKERIEREVDPRLYLYATAQAFAMDYAKAHEYAVAERGPASAVGPRYTGGIYDEIRDREYQYRLKRLELISQRADRVAMALLAFFEGDFTERGFRWEEGILLFAFNVALDFVSVSIWVYGLRWLGTRLLLRWAIGVWCLCIISTAFCLVVSIFSYRMFLHGNIAVFTQLIQYVPAGLIALGYGVVGAGFLAYAALNSGKERPGWVAILVGVLLLGSFLVGGYIGIMRLSSVWEYWRRTALAAVSWGDYLRPPYSLALTTVVPAGICGLALALVVVGKLIAEPMRVLPELYMTFVKEETSGTQAAGMILLLGIVTGALLGVISATS